MKFSANQLKMLRLLYISNVKNEGLSGVEISREIKVGIGSVYPFLTRLLNEGLATAEWENICPKTEGRPRKRYYQLTGDGVRMTHEALADFQLVELNKEGVPEPGGGIIHV